MKDILFDNNLFGFFITLFAYVFIYKYFKEKNILAFNPMVMALLFLIGFLVIFKIPVEQYDRGASIWAYFLGPSTVALSVSLYKQVDRLKKHALPIIIGITVGSAVGLLTVVLLSKAFGIDKGLFYSLIPRSTTMAIGTEISKNIGGYVPITTASIIIVGNLGNIFGEHILKIAKIKEPTAKGLALGTSSHVFGTSKAMEIGEEEGAMSSLAIGVAGLITAVIVPFFI